jgi:uncharacterized protein related to proFAR isomerase
MKVMIMSNIHPSGEIAVYKPQLVKQYQGNKLIEALPELMGRKQIAKALAHKPAFTVDEKEYPFHIREASMSRIFEYFQPLGAHLEYASKLGLMIRNGYIGRRMNPARDLMTKEELNEYMSAMSEVAIFDCVKSAATIGMSGMGKTSTTERILNLYPQLIIHERPYNTYQVVWVKLDCPVRGSLKSLCLRFFNAMDKILDTKYEQMYQSKSLDIMLSMMADVADRHYLGLIVIDEIQHLVGAKGTGERDMLNFLVTMNNVVKVPVLLIGTPNARKLLGLDFRQCRRMDGENLPDWKRIPNDKHWKFFVEGFWRLNWLRGEQELTQELIDAFHKESQGIIDVVLKLYAAAHYRAMLTKTEKITEEDIEFVAKNNIPNMRKIINALKVDPEMAEKMYGDVTAATVGQVYESVRNSCDVSELVSGDTDAGNTLIGKAVAILLTLDVPANYAERLVIEAVKKNPDIEAIKLVDKVFASYEKLTKSKKVTNSRADKPELLEYLSIAKEQDCSVDYALKSDGLIKSPMEDFDMGIDD